MLARIYWSWRRRRIEAKMLAELPADARGEMPDALVHAVSFQLADLMRMLARYRAAKFLHVKLRARPMESWAERHMREGIEARQEGFADMWRAVFESALAVHDEWPRGR